MDRAEKIGLTTAIGGHAILLLALTIGIFGISRPFEKSTPIAVSLVGDIGPESTAPDATLDEPAPADEKPEETAPTPEIVKIAEPVTEPKPAPTAKEPKPAPKPAPVAKPKPAEAQPAPAKPKGFSRNFEKIINNSSQADGKGTAVGTPAAKPATEVRRSVNATLAGQIKPYLEACAPSGVDIDAIRTFITLNLDIDGSLNNVRFDKQTGINASNSPQADLLRQCAINAARQASPYRGLDPEYHDIWKSHALQLKAQ